MLQQLDWDCQLFSLLGDSKLDSLFYCNLPSQDCEDNTQVERLVYAKLYILGKSISRLQ